MYTQNTIKHELAPGLGAKNSNWGHAPEVITGSCVPSFGYLRHSSSSSKYARLYHAIPTYLLACMRRANVDSYHQTARRPHMHASTHATQLNEQHRRALAQILKERADPHLVALDGPPD